MSESSYSAESGNNDPNEYSVGPYRPAEPYWPAGPNRPIAIRMSITIIKSAYSKPLHHKTSCEKLYFGPQYIHLILTAQSGSRANRLQVGRKSQSISPCPAQVFREDSLCLQGSVDVTRVFLTKTILFQRGWKAPHSLQLVTEPFPPGFSREFSRLLTSSVLSHSLLRCHYFSLVHSYIDGASANGKFGFVQ